MGFDNFKRTAEHLGGFLDTFREVAEITPDTIKMLIPSGIMLNAISHWLSYSNVTHGISWILTSIASIITVLYLWQKLIELRAKNRMEEHENPLRLKQIEKELEEIKEKEGSQDEEV